MDDYIKKGKKNCYRLWPCLSLSLKFGFPHMLLLDPETESVTEVQVKAKIVYKKHMYKNFRRASKLAYKAS